MTIVPLSLGEANELVSRWHRHHTKVVGHKFSIGVADDAGEVVGAIIIGRPVARHLDDGMVLEVTRCVTDGTKNASSALYGAARRACFALGYRRLITYTRTDESGVSLGAAGWRCIAQRPKQGWNRPGRPRVEKTEPHARLLWEASGDS